MFGSITYIPVYLQIVKGSSPTASGLQMLPLMVGVLVASIGSGQITTRTGRYRMFPIIGTALMTIGMLLLSRLEVGTSILVADAYMLVLGLGLGFVMQMLVLAVQNAVDYEDLGVATPAPACSGRWAGSIGTPVFGAILANQLAGEPGRRRSRTCRGLGSGSQHGATPATITELPARIHAPLSPPTWSRCSRCSWPDRRSRWWPSASPG